MDQRALEVNILEDLRRQTERGHIPWKQYILYPGGSRRFIAFWRDYTLLLEWPANRQCAFSMYKNGKIITFDNPLISALWFGVTGVPGHYEAADHATLDDLAALSKLLNEITH